jgi:hypothetical protein
MIAILFVVIIRLIIYIDMIFTDQMAPILANSEQQGRTINTMVRCNSNYFKNN